MGSYGRCLDPDWRRSFNHENTNHPTGEPPLRLRRSGNCVPLPPAPPYSSAAIVWQAEEAQRAIDTSARIRRTAELYARFIDPSIGEPWDEGHTQRGNGNGGPTTPKPGITPKPQFPPPRTIQGNQP
jgi:hypothetical protein